MRRCNVNFWPGNNKFRAYVNSDVEKYDDTCIGYFNTEKEAWQAILDYCPRSDCCMPGANKPRLDLERIEIGKIYDDHLALDSRFVRDGTFHSGHLEFYMVAMNPTPGKTNEFWCKEKTIQEFMEGNGI